MLARIVPITEFRNRARELLASLGDRPIVLTQRGRPAAVVLRYEDYESREEYVSRMEMERDRQLFLEAKATETEFVPLEEAFAEYERVTGYNLDDYEG
jgi:prevent-host-death family protein